MAQVPGSTPVGLGVPFCRKDGLGLHGAELGSDGAELCSVGWPGTVKTYVVFCWKVWICIELSYVLFEGLGLYRAQLCSDGAQLCSDGAQLSSV